MPCLVDVLRGLLFSEGKVDPGERGGREDSGEKEGRRNCSPYLIHERRIKREREITAP